MWSNGGEGRYVKERGLEGRRTYDQNVLSMRRGGRGGEGERGEGEGGRGKVEIMNGRGMREKMEGSERNRGR